jgi:transposase
MRSTRDQTAVQASKVEPMKTWNELKHYAGLDWAKGHHDVVIVDRDGTIVAEFGFEHSAQGWEKFRQNIKPYPHLGVALETNHGIVVDQLLEASCLVFAIHPKSAKHYRDRKIPSGNKTDRADAWTLAEALRTDGRPWNPVSLEQEATQQIRLLCRDEIALIDQRTLLVNQLQQALRDYFPAALEAFEDWTLESTWDFVIQFPTPQALTLAGKRRWEKFLHTHRM